MQILLDAGGAFANEFRGSSAGPGTYRLTLTVDGSAIPHAEVRADPFSEGGSDAVDDARISSRFRFASGTAD